MVKLYEQVDEVTTGKYRYQWILCGVPYAKRKLLPGWTWLSGLRKCPGCYVTKDYAEVEKLNLPIETNGTHAVHKAPMYKKAG